MPPSPTCTRWPAAVSLAADRGATPVARRTRGGLSAPHESGGPARGGPAEAAFRALKSALAIRPVFHHLERRVKAHVLIAFLGYALWVTLKHQLRRRGTGLSPSQALAQLATLQSADIVLPTTDGREIRLRRVARPIREQQHLLDQLEIAISAYLEWNAECSGDFAAS
jgi:hypothetical protein